MKYDYEWDENKKLANLEKHGLSFDDAKFVFSSQIVTFIDDRYPYNEERYVTLGTLNKLVVIIVYTYRDSKIRIISMRKANEREQKIYQERLRTS